MNGFLIALLAFILLEALVGVSRIGKPRGPYTPQQAVAGIIDWVLIAALAILAVNA